MIFSENHRVKPEGMLFRIMLQGIDSLTRNYSRIDAS
jgi:hypothetical protein